MVFFLAFSVLPGIVRHIEASCFDPGFVSNGKTIQIPSDYATISQAVGPDRAPSLFFAGCDERRVAH
jgi:hypothetical protein